MTTPPVINAAFSATITSFACGATCPSVACKPVRRFSKRFRQGLHINLTLETVQVRQFFAIMAVDNDHAEIIERGNMLTERRIDILDL